MIGQKKKKNLGVSFREDVFVSLPCVRNTNNCVCVFECGRQKFVGEYTCCICETEEAVVREDGSNSHEMGMQNAFMTHG